MPAGGPWSDRIGDRSPTRACPREACQGGRGPSRGRGTKQVSIGWRGVRVYDAPTAGKGRAGEFSASDLLPTSDTERIILP
jgi:hypothetical protein